MTVTLINPMGGETEGFLEQYEWTDAGGGRRVVTYTPDKAGGSVGEPFYEGWTVGGAEWQPGQPEIVGFPDPFEGASWNAFNPDTEMMYGFVGFEDEGPPPA